MKRIISIFIIMFMAISTTTLAKDYTLTIKRCYMSNASYKDNLTIISTIVDLEAVTVNKTLTITSEENWVINLSNVQAEKINIINAKGKTINLDNIRTKELILDSSNNVVAVKNSKIDNMQIKKPTKLLLCKNISIKDMNVDINHNNVNKVEIQLTSGYDKAIQTGQTLMINIQNIKINTPVEIVSNSSELLKKIYIPKDLLGKVKLTSTIKESKKEEESQGELINKGRILVTEANVIDFHRIEVVFDGAITEDISNKNFKVKMNSNNLSINSVYKYKENSLIVDLNYNLQFEKSIYKPTIEKVLKQNYEVSITYRNANQKNTDTYMIDFKVKLEVPKLQDIKGSNIIISGSDYKVDNNKNIIEMNTNKFMKEFIDEIKYKGNVEILYSNPDANGLIDESSILTIIVPDGGSVSYKFKMKYTS